MQPVSPLVAHWQELWYRLAYIGLSWCLGFCVCLWKAHLFLYALATPLAHYGPSRFMFTHLAEGLQTQVSLSLWLSLLMALPLLWYHIMCFLRPGWSVTQAKQAQEWSVRGGIWCALWLGIWWKSLGLLWPIFLQFGWTIGDLQYQLEPRLSQYFGLCLQLFGLSLGIGVFPWIAQILCDTFGVSAAWLCQWRGLGWLSALLLAAFLSPVDFFIQTGLTLLGGLCVEGFLFWQVLQEAYGTPTP